MTYTPSKRETFPIPIEPSVISIFLSGTAGAAVDYAVYIPWKNCRLDYVYTVCTTAEGNNGAGSVVLELNAASGTTITTMAIAQNATVGTLVEGTIVAAPASNLSSDNSARDAINIQLTLAGSSEWQGTLFMYFVSDYGEGS